MTALVTCWNCNTQYTSSMDACPSCRSVYRPSEEELVTVATEEAFGLLKAGKKREDVRAQLAAAHDLPDLSLDEALAAAQRRIRAASKQHGQQIAGSGCVLLLAAGAIFLITGGFIVATGCLALGIPMLIAGILKARTGWNLTGHDFES